MGIYQVSRHGNRLISPHTQRLDAAGIAKAAVETVAENASDGVIAPMIFIAIGGVPLGFFYKAVNTMDSMVGYKNEKYLYFGRAAAKLDDVMNYVPSRIYSKVKSPYKFWKESSENDPNIKGYKVRGVSK